MDSILAKSKSHKFYNKKYKKILIAPSWGKKNLINLCGLTLTNELLKENYEIVLRPHPRSLIEDKETIKEMKRLFLSNSNFYLDEEVIGESGLDYSDVLITDWSGVAIEFAFGKERPVVFVNSPKKINNPLYLKLELEHKEKILEPIWI